MVRDLSAAGYLTDLCIRAPPRRGGNRQGNSGHFAVNPGASKALKTTPGHAFAVKDEVIGGTKASVNGIRLESLLMNWFDNKVPVTEGAEHEAACGDGDKIMAVIACRRYVRVHRSDESGDAVQE